MKTKSLYGFYLIACLCFYFCSFAQKTVTYYGQTFKIDTLYPKTGTTGMNSAWEMVYGPDDSLWVTAARDYKLYKIHPGDKGVRLIHDFISSNDIDFTNPPVWPQGGLMGLAIHPEFASGKPWVYIAYVYHQVACGTSSGGNFCSFNTKISRYQYVSGNLIWMDDIITTLNGSNDHNSGRLRINPNMEADGRYHLYYTIGDMGAGNLANVGHVNHAQDTAVLEGKVLRFNTEPDLAMPLAQRWIPGDNPFPGGAAATAKNPIYSFGHRNPQGLDFGSVNGGASYILYSAEHGDQSDDEVNIILPHSNYGWPKVTGLCDDNYTSTNGDSMYLAGKAVISETGFCQSTPTTLQEPIFTFWSWSRSANKTAQGKPSNSYWPTIAPASITFYGAPAIPGWNHSLLVPSLKNGMYRLKLRSDGLAVDSTTLPTDTLHYFPGLRLRQVTVAPSGDTLFVSVDNSCCAIDSAGTFGTSVANPPYKGYILRMIYLTTLSLPDHPATPTLPAPPSSVCKVYPNPVHGTLFVQAKYGERMPWVASLYDITGKMLLRELSSEDNFSLDVHAFSPGIYIFRLENGYAVPLVTEKVLIQ